jgi:hypothetical protein
MLTQLNSVVVRIYISDIMNMKFNIRIIDILLARVGVNLLKPICYVMHHQFNIQQLYAQPTLYLCVLYLSEDKQRLFHLQHKPIGF